MKAKKIAMGGVTAALAVVIMCMGGLIPIATFVCPLICCMILQIISGTLGKQMCWVWYVSVSLIALLLCPDKEAAFVFAFLGYYPIIRTAFPAGIWGWILKAAYFNTVILAMYWLMINLFGMAAVAQEYAALGTAMTLVTLLLGNVTFFLLDRLLAILKRRF